MPVHKPITYLVAAGALLSPAVFTPHAVAASTTATTAQVATAAAVSNPSSALHLSRAQIITRAKSWADAAVPYSQSKYYTNEYGTYRTDCSGFVSMAWGLPSSYVTQTLPQVSTTIARSDLRAGDVLNESNDHVIMFNAWVDKAKGDFTYYSESRPGVPTALRSGNLSGYTNFIPRRYNNVVEVPETGTSGVGVQGDGNRVFFADVDGQVRNDYLANGQWQGPAPIGDAHTTSDIVVGPDSKSLFYTESGTGRQGRIGTAWQDSTGWHNSVLAGSGTGIGVGKYGSATEVFYRTPAGTIQMQYNSGNGWKGPMTIGTGHTDGPITVSPKGDQIFYHDDKNDRVGVAWRTADGSWDSSILAENGTYPTAAIFGKGTVEVFYHNPATGQIRLTWNSGAGWQKPINVGTAHTSGPISAQADGTSIFYTEISGTAKGRVGTAWRTSTGAWDNSLIPGSGTNPTVGGTTYRRVFFRDTNGVIQNDWNSGNGWQGPSPTGGGN